jgi:hypothetical protein
MTPVLVSVDRAGDLKLGKRKCRLHKKADVVKVAKKYDVPGAEKKTVQELCRSIRARAKASNDGMNNVPLAKLYPEAARKRAEKKATAANFIKTMVTKRIVTPTMVMVRAVSPVRIPKPTKKAAPLTKEEAIMRIKAMKGLNQITKGTLMERVKNQKKYKMSPRRVVKVARALSRINGRGRDAFR